MNSTPAAGTTYFIAIYVKYEKKVVIIAAVPLGLAYWPQFEPYAVPWSL
jgi:hypothetical protein